MKKCTLVLLGSLLSLSASAYRRPVVGYQQFETYRKANVNNCSLGKKTEVGDLSQQSYSCRRISGRGQVVVTVTTSGVGSRCSSVTDCSVKDGAQQLTCAQYFTK